MPILVAGDVLEHGFMLRLAQTILTTIVGITARISLPNIGSVGLAGVRSIAAVGATPRLARRRARPTHVIEQSNPRQSMPS